MVTVILAACKSGTKDEQPAAAPVSPAAEARREQARKLDKGDITARTAGPDDTILEFTSKSRGCKLENITPIVNASGQTLVNAGFRMVRCIGSGDFVELDGRPTAPAPVDVKLPTLIADYKANAIGADAKYRDKVLRVTALVKKVGRNSLDEPVVLLELAADPEGFRAKFASDTGLAELRPFDTIVMRCRGGNEFGKPTLTACELDK